MVKLGSMNKGGMIAQLIGAFITILIGISLIPIISEQVKLVQSTQTNTSDSLSDSLSSPMIKTMLDLLPAFFAIAIVGIGIAIAVGALRSVGLFGENNDIIEPTVEEIKTARRKKDEEEREEVFVYKPKYKSPKYEYEDEVPSKPVMDPVVFEEKKKAYDEKMKSFNDKKKLSDKDLEKNL